MKQYDVETSAEIVGVSRQTITRMIADGALEAVQIRAGRRKKIVRIPESSLRKLLHVPRNEPLESAVISKKEKRRSGAPELAVIEGGEQQ